MPFGLLVIFRGPAQKLGALGYWAPASLFPCAGCLRNAVAIKDFCTLSLKSGAPDDLGQLRLLMEEKIQRLRLEMKSLSCPRVLLPWGNALCR